MHIFRNLLDSMVQHLPKGRRLAHLLKWPIQTDPDSGANFIPCRCDDNFRR
jgi:hypothetical protein